MPEGEKAGRPNETGYFLISMFSIFNHYSFRKKIQSVIPLEKKDFKPSSFRASKPQASRAYKKLLILAPVGYYQLST